MNKTIIVLLILVIIIAGGWYFSRSQAPVSPTPSPTPQTEIPPAPAAPSPTTSGNTSGQVKEFTVTGQNYSFSPSSISVKKGDTVKITFKNTGGMHDLRIDAFGGVGTPRIETGKEATFQFIADKTGTYEYYCSVGSHRAMGMKGALMVTE